MRRRRKDGAPQHAEPRPQFLEQRDEGDVPWPAQREDRVALSPSIAADEISTGHDHGWHWWIGPVLYALLGNPATVSDWQRHSHRPGAGSPRASSFRRALDRNAAAPEVRHRIRRGAFRRGAPCPAPDLRPPLPRRRRPRGLGPSAPDGLRRPQGVCPQAGRTARPATRPAARSWLWGGGLFLGGRPFWFRGPGELQCGQLHAGPSCSASHASGAGVHQRAMGALERGRDGSAAGGTHG
mmetsp:Transcript_6258/g.17685  ORF Transcript_6258/g.17685 Transcript_6258/m.17685 type:complete len:239 (+) Transcript_6258:2130-2846(+)